MPDGTDKYVLLLLAVRKENEMQTYVFTNDNVTMMILNDNGEIQVNATSLNDTST